MNDGAQVELNESCHFQDFLTLLSQDSKARLGDCISVCHSVRNDMDLPENQEDGLVNLLMRPCYKFSKLAKQRFFDDPHFSFLFIIFAVRGRPQIDRKAQESTEPELYFQIVKELKD